MSRRIPPTFMPATPVSQPAMTSPTPSTNENDVVPSDESNDAPFWSAFAAL